MNLTLKTKVIVSGVVILTAFAAGRYSAPTVPNTKVDVKTDTNTHTQTDTNKTTVITEDPGGKKTTTITENTKTNTEKVTDTQKDTVVTAPKASIINISALAGLDTGRGFVPTYGVSASKELIGPLSVGAFGLTNGTIGVSVGLSF